MKTRKATGIDADKGVISVDFIQKMAEGRRITAVVGHFGSGKTEFCVSLAFALASRGSGSLALIDLDIANPYFRSREQKDPLEAAGISVYGSAYGTEITAELPALDPAARAPLEDPSCRVIVDVGGDYSGAKILNQYTKYFKPGGHDLFCVINANRPETQSLDGAVNHLRAIEEQTSLKVTGLISNAHFVSFTQAEDVMEGYKLTAEVSRATGIPVAAVCAREAIVDRVAALRDRAGFDFDIMPVGLYMRASWLDISL